jgi:hypothetical protein
MSLLRVCSSGLLALFLVLMIFGISGCASTQDSDNASVRPWNTPKGWENGLPSQMQEGR